MSELSHKQAGRLIAQKLYKLDKCELCDFPAEVRHHRNGDTWDNRPENIMCLCSCCHSRVHFHGEPKPGDKWPKREWPPNLSFPKVIMKAQNKKKLGKDYEHNLLVVASMRMAGYSYDEIGAELGFSKQRAAIYGQRVKAICRNNFQAIRAMLTKLLK